MTDKQIKELNEQIKKAIRRIENIGKKYDELREKYKAKEQECEELKDKLNCCFCNPIMEIADYEHFKKCVEVTECFRRQLDQLKKENETYKSSIVANLDKSISKRYRELLEENDQLKETNEGLLSIQYKLADSNLKLRKTLAEIKKLVEKEFCRHIECCEFCANSNECVNQKIIEKVNEVEDEKNM